MDNVYEGIKVTCLSLTCAATVIGVALVGHFALEGGSAEPPRLEVASTFDVAEAAYIHETGEGTVEGRVFVRLWSGEEVPCTESPVLLVPQTTLSRERMAYLYGGTDEPGRRRHARNGAKLEAPDPQYWDYMRESSCDDQGRFRFAGVADGGYYVVGSIAWKDVNGWVAVSLMQPVLVEGGKRIQVILTPRRET